MTHRAKSKGRRVHCATLMDLCHLKNSELEKKTQGEVSRGDMVKDDSGSYAARCLSVTHDESSKS